MVKHTETMKKIINCRIFPKVREKNVANGRLRLLRKITYQGRKQIK